MTKKYTKGEDAQDYLQTHLGLTDYLCVASTPDEDGGGFSLIIGEPAMIVSLLTMLVKNNPELFIQVVAAILRVFVEITPEQMIENAEKMGEGCNCEGCAKDKGKATDGETIH